MTEPVEWENGRRADVKLGVLDLTLFTQAIYEDSCSLPAEGFLHPALFVDDLDAELARHEVLWGPRTVSGTFGTRRIAFVEAPGGIRLEFMQQVEEPRADVPTCITTRQEKTTRVGRHVVVGGVV